MKYLILTIHTVDGEWLPLILEKFPLLYQSIQELSILKYNEGLNLAYPRYAWNVDLSSSRICRAQAEFLKECLNGAVNDLTLVSIYWKIPFDDEGEMLKQVKEAALFSEDFKNVLKREKEVWEVIRQQSIKYGLWSDNNLLLETFEEVLKAVESPSDKKQICHPGL